MMAKHVCSLCGVWYFVVMIKSGLDKGSDDVVSCFLRRRTVKLVGKAPFPC